MKIKSLQDVLKEYAENKEDRPVSQSIGKFYPSSVGKCNRAIVYQMLGYPQKKKDLKSYLILENGTYFHDRAEKFFKESGYLIASELPLKDARLHISGRLDLVMKNTMKERETQTPILLRDANNAVVYDGFAEDVMIVELKSISSSGFERLGNKPKPEHEDQLMLYMEMTGIKDGKLFYENKNDQTMREFDVEYSKAKADKIINKILFCVDCYENNQLPTKEFDKHDFDCTYCDFRSLCWPSSNTYNLEDIL